jgi:hypothetical protein
MGVRTGARRPHQAGHHLGHHHPDHTGIIAALTSDPRTDHDTAYKHLTNALYDPNGTMTLMSGLAW